MSTVTFESETALAEAIEYATGYHPRHPSVAEEFALHTGTCSACSQTRAVATLIVEEERPQVLCLACAF